MPNRVQQSVARLAARLQSRAGVSVTYTRDAGTPQEQSVQVTAITGGERQPITEPQARATRVDRLERDFLIRSSELLLGGASVVPAEGDRITETIDGVVCVFESIKTPTEPAWRYTDATRAMIRIHTKQVL
jgi:hypothetical protein